ncbi:MAG: hypothetical protein U0163_15140, partial [Gemmatimonadaceae bacterium]
VAGPNRVEFRIGGAASAVKGGRLNPGTGTRVRFLVQISPSATNGQVISDQAFLTYRDASNDALDVESSGPVQGAPGPTTVVVEAPDLTIAKSHTGNFVRGQQATYSLTVSNVGSAPSSGTITVTDVLPTGLSFVSATGSGWSCSAAASTVTCTSAGPVAAGGALPSVTLTLDVASTAPSTVTNTATVAGGSDSNGSNNSASDPTTIVGAPDVAITKTHTGAFTVGSNGAYTIGVTNVGNAPTTGPITVSDVLPTGLTYVTATGTGWSCSAVAQAVTCTHAGPVAASASLPAITMTVSVGAAAAPSVVNTASVSTPGDTNASNDSASDPTTVNPAPVPDLAITKSHTGTFTVGSTGTYTLTVTNVGTGPTTSTITVSDVLPTGLTYVTATGTGWSCNAVTQAVTCTTPGPLAPTSALPAITLTVSVSPSAVPSVTNTATVSTAGDTNGANDSASDPTTVVPAPTPDLAISKTHAGAFVVGSNGIYTIGVANVGLAATTGTITVGDVLPTGLTYVSATGTNWTCAAVGQTVTCTNPGPVAASANLPNITLTVAVGPTAQPSVTNTATVSTPGDANSANDSASDPTLVGASGIDLAIAKSAAPSTFVVGANASYTLTITNVGANPTTSPVVVTDTLPTGLSLVAATGATFTCTASGQAVTCTRSAALTSGSSAQVVITVLVGTGTGALVTNRAHVDTSGDTNATNDVAQVSNPVGTPPDLELIKTATPSSFVVGLPGAFTLTVHNVGGSAANGPTTVVDTLSAGITFVSVTGSGWSCSAVAQIVTCSVAGPLAPGATTSAILHVTVTAAAAPGVTNTAHVSTPGDPNPGNDTGQVTVPVGSATAPDVAIVKQALGTFVVGQPAVYQLTVTNVGTGPTTGPVVVSDNLPAALTYVSASGTGWGCSATGQLVTCTYAAVLAPAQSTAITITVVPTNASPLSNTATVSTPGDTGSGNNSSTVTTPVSPSFDLTVVKALNGSLTRGATATYMLTVSNVGQQPSSGPVIVVDSLPAGLSFVSGAGTGFTCSASGRVVQCVRTAPPIAVGEHVAITLTVNVLATAPASLSNTACVNSSGDGNPSNDCSTDTHQLTTQPDLSITKTHVGTPAIGQRLVFTLRVRNVGSATAAPPITVEDVLPAGLQFESAAGPGGPCTFANATVSCTSGAPLAAGDSADVTIFARVLAQAVPLVTNCARVQSADDAVPTNNQACDAVPVAGDYRLGIEKTVSKPEAEVGNVVDYTITVRGLGATAVPDAMVTDRLPDGFVYLNGSARLGGQSQPDPTGAPGPELVFAVGQVPSGAAVRLTYRVRIGVGAHIGQNRNLASVASPLTGATSPTVSATVLIRPSVFDERGVIVGKIVQRCACGGGPQEAGDVGIPGVRVLLEDGTTAITDVEGKFSFANVSARLHVVKVDRTTLPDGSVLVTTGNRNARDAYSRFADVKAGELYRADFIEGSGQRAVADQSWHDVVRGRCRTLASRRSPS